METKKSVKNSCIPMKMSQNIRRKCLYPERAVFVWVKADLHLHSSLDYLDVRETSFVFPHPMQWIDHAAENGFSVLSFTHHGIRCDELEIFDYARSRNILLIPGEEAFIEGKHVLLYAFPPCHVLTFKELAELRSSENLVIAPHPFFPESSCLGESLLKHLELFDAIEFSHFYHRFINFNHRAVEVAKKYGKPLIGNSDAHCLEQFGTTFSWVNIDDLSIAAVIQAIKNGSVRIETRPLRVSEIMKTLIAASNLRARLNPFFTFFK